MSPNADTVTAPALPGENPSPESSSPVVIWPAVLVRVMLPPVPDGEKVLVSIKPVLILPVALSVTLPDRDGSLVAVLIPPVVMLAAEIVTVLPEAVMVCVGSIENRLPAVNVMEPVAIVVPPKVRDRPGLTVMLFVASRMMLPRPIPNCRAVCEMVMDEPGKSVLKMSGRAESPEPPPPR